MLLTRAPLYRGRGPFSCDLHVLSAPLTFVLSQDQTLQLILSQTSRRSRISRPIFYPDPSLPLSLDSSRYLASEGEDPRRHVTYNSVFKDRGKLPSRFQDREPISRRLACQRFFCRPVFFFVAPRDQQTPQATLDACGTPLGFRRWGGATYSPGSQCQIFFRPHPAFVSPPLSLSFLCPAPALHPVPPPTSLLPLDSVRAIRSLAPLPSPPVTRPLPMATSRATIRAGFVRVFSMCVLCGHFNHLKGKLFKQENLS